MTSAVPAPPPPDFDEVDVLVVGAGLSGIAAGYHLQDKCPGKSYAILEMRESMGGTWDLFRYPGIRSDSDMFTLGYAFRPWADTVSLADGPSILAYIEQTAEMYGIDQHIHYQRRVEGASWSSETARWTVDVRNVATGEVRQVRCEFLFLCSGYYDYEEGYTPEFQGIESFGGQVIHPQFWPEDLDYEGKKVVVIGSGATAVTLVPELAKKAAHVTMLQRSPTYVLSIPGQDPVAKWLKKRLPEKLAYGAIRWKNILFAQGFYLYSRARPERARRWILKQAEGHLEGTTPIDPHFSPSYDPWDQRLCFVPDSDLFVAIRTGAASVVTDHIDAFTENGIRLQSGEELEADIVVTATGLKLKLLAGLTFDVDGESIHPNETVLYKGTMLSGVPNFAFAVGYTNASWTLKCDLCCEYVCRMLQHMEAEGYSQVVPRVPEGMGRESALPLESGYIKRAQGQLPLQGDKAPWKLFQNYAFDRAWLKHGPMADQALEFRRDGRRRSKRSRREPGDQSAARPS